VDLLIDASIENEARVFAALATLPDGCVRELDAGDVSKYAVVRVADEILIDLMASASGIDYAEASKSVVVHEIQGVPIPFASPELLYRIKTGPAARRTAATSISSSNSSPPKANRRRRSYSTRNQGAVRKTL